MRVLICGGRNFKDASAIEAPLDELLKEHCWLTIIEGGALGADRIAQRWAIKNKTDLYTFHARWGDVTRDGAVVKRHTAGDGKECDAAAGGARNQRMIDAGKPDLVLAFAGGKGTADMVRRARAAGITVREIK